MPHFDGTGPKGKGPFTGRGMGFCVARIEQLDVASFGGTVPSDQGQHTDEHETTGKEVIQMPKHDGKGPPTGAKGPQDGRGKGKGRAQGKGVGKSKGGKKGTCK